MITLNQFIIQAKHPKLNSDVGFIILMTVLENAVKMIETHVSKMGLADLMEKTTDVNSSGEEIKKIDQVANDILVKMLSESGQISRLASEEVEEMIYTPYPKAPYEIYFDPLDGASNINIGGMLGVIFSIYHSGPKGSLPRGEEQIAAGYVLYGSSTILVYATHDGVNGFTLDPASGCFLLSHINMTMPQKALYYSINEGYANHFSDKTNRFLANIKKAGTIKGRNLGCMCADFHNALINGGVYLYPANKKDPQGKIRLMYEINPMSFIAQIAGGSASVDGQDPLKIAPLSLHQKMDFVVGSKDIVFEYAAS